MKKLFLCILLLFPTIAFGQSFTGNYRAVFFNLFSDSKTIIAEFEVKSNNSINGKVKVGDEIKLFNGSVDKKGKFEAVSQTDGNTVYKLKGKFDKDNKISFIQRVQVGSGMNRSVSENGFEGTFAKFTPPTAEQPQSPANKEFSVADNGKSQLVFLHSNQLFGNQWNDFVGKVDFDESAGVKRLRLTAEFVNEKQTRLLRIITKPILSDQKIWKSTEILSASYREDVGVLEKKNLFLTPENIYAENKALQSGTLEIVKETDKQYVFKLVNFRTKRFMKDDYVELNGFVYADK